MSPGRAFARAWAAGSALATLVFVWLITAGSFDLLRRTRLNGDFYDAQAHALLHGNLAIPHRILTIEAFRSQGRTYTYFPPGPALVRLPVAALTDRLDGRTAPLLMTVAFVIALVGAGFLAWRIRGLVRPAAPVGRGQQLVYGAVAVLVGVGTPLSFMASRSWIYHEAALWALAFALCAADQVLAFVTAPTGRRLARAGGFAGCAVLSRATIGAGPLLALALVGVVVVVVRLLPRTRALADRCGLAPAVCHPRRWLPGLVAAVAVPTAVYATFNWLKFRTFFSVPYDRQMVPTAQFQDVLAANHDSLFNVRAIPTQLLALFRPDGLALGRVFPFVGFPRTAPRIVGAVVFDQRNLTASVTATMTLVLVGAVVGVVALVRRPAAAPLRLPVVASVVVLPVTLSIVYVAQRYTGDVLMPLVLCAFLGLEVALHAAPSWRTGVRRTVTVVVAAAAAFGVWTGVALALEYQRVLVPFVPPGERAQYVGWQLDAGGLPGAADPVVLSGDALPDPAPLGTLFVLGDCRALYQSTGTGWGAVERTRAGGAWTVTVDPDPARSGTDPVLGFPGGTIGLRRLPDDRARFVLTDSDDAVTATGRPFRLTPGDRRTFAVVVDGATGELSVTGDGAPLLGATYSGPAVTRATVGAWDVGFPDRLHARALPEPAPDRCRRVQRLG